MADLLKIWNINNFVCETLLTSNDEYRMVSKMTCTVVPNGGDDVPKGVVGVEFRNTILLKKKLSDDSFQTVRQVRRNFGDEYTTRLVGQIDTTDDNFLRVVEEKCVKLFDEWWEGDNAELFAMLVDTYEMESLRTPTVLEQAVRLNQFVYETPFASVGNFWLIAQFTFDTVHDGNGNFVTDDGFWVEMTCDLVVKKFDPETGTSVVVWSTPGRANVPHDGPYQYTLSFEVPAYDPRSPKWDEVWHAKCRAVDAVDVMPRFDFTPQEALVNILEKLG